MLSPHRYCTATSGTIGSITGDCGIADDGDTRWLFLPSPLWALTPLLPVPPLDDDDADEYSDEGNNDDARELMGTVHRSV